MTLKYHKHILPLLITAKDIAVETGEEPKLSLNAIFEAVENIQYLEHAAARIGASYHIMKRELEAKLKRAEDGATAQGRGKLIEALRHADEALRLSVERERALEARVDTLVDEVGEMKAAANDDAGAITMLETALTHETTRLKASQTGRQEAALKAQDIHARQTRRHEAEKRGIRFAIQVAMGRG